MKLVPPAPPVFPRYLYLSPPKPKAGDRKAAAGAFADAQQSEQNQDLTAAMNSYRKAAELDPAWFEAQYNYAVLACRLRDFNHSLAASEMALALQPDSADARYNFALALKSAGYATDAVNELKKIVAANPDEARAQLALGNLYARAVARPGAGAAALFEMAGAGPAQSAGDQHPLLALRQSAVKILTGIPERRP